MHSAFDQVQTNPKEVRRYKFHSLAPYEIGTKTQDLCHRNVNKKEMRYATGLDQCA
jgi:hypothetical protein